MTNNQGRVIALTARGYRTLAEVLTRLATNGTTEEKCAAETLFGELETIPATTETAYIAEYQEFGDDTWWVAGDMYGYPDRKDAEAAIEARADKWKDSRFHKPVSAARIRTVTTTTTTRPYILV
ncbi:hypothetical protein I1A49_16375 [Streptomyces malaysiensis subsp. malaysiensis]|uniref:Uncharacterized protein n=1 Tax=Streptomyces malaysiensis TaxID=92644 RepID=A0ABX6W478_STRMQ|nr:MULTISPECIES: hypothetical protein [Streptomyces]QPI56305.1 hypothetical protein I1A49_16375 [Streptomyces solisilvae]UHH17789.1 hypothetical protein LUV23_16495 [Streptomyces sp. HNM0561]